MRFQTKLLAVNIGFVLAFFAGCSNIHKNISTRVPDCSATISKLCENLEGSQKYHVWCEIMGNLFEPNAVKIEFFTYDDVHGEKILSDSGTVWFSKGQLFIQRSVDVNNSDEERFNYATINGKVYEWNSITNKGRIYKRYDGDTFEFLLYFVDVSGIKMSIYQEYSKNPEDFRVTEHGSIKTIEYIRPRYGFEGIQVIENPLWLYSMMLRNHTDSPCQIHVFKRPESVDKIPDYLKKLPDSIIFKESDSTLKARMVYL